ncbi:MAG: tandem-95 repeat protein, partial [Methanoregulaceae archaeon]
MSKKVDYISLKQEGNRIKFSIKGESSANILLNNTVATSVLRDGIVYTDWVLDQNTQTLKISTTLNEHEFEISSEDRLSINSISRTTVNVSELLMFPLGVTYTGKGVVQASASNLPQYATFNSTSRTFSWTPDTNQIGNYSVTFTVTDGRLSDSSTVLITVKEANQAPVFEDIENKTVIVRSHLQFAINAMDADGNSLTYSAAGLPANATFNPVNRTFSWTPDTNQTGITSVTFEVTDGRLSDSRDVQLTVKTANRAPVLDEIGNKTVPVHAQLQFAVNATDADGDLLVYSAMGLPANATFDPASHTFSWTPADNQAGSYNVTFNVSDGLLTDSRSVQILVTGSNNRAPVIGAIANASVNQKETLNVSVTASDPDGDVLTYSATSLPAGAKFDPATRQFTWSPAYNQAGNYTVTFWVTDGMVSVSRNVTFTAVKVNYAPSFMMANITTKTLSEGTAIQLDI